MNRLITETNQFLKDSSIRKEWALEAAIASFELEGVNISREIAFEIAGKVDVDVRKYLR